MADRKTWGNRLMWGGAAIFGVGLLIRLVGGIGAGRKSGGGSGDVRSACGDLWVRKDGPYFLDNQPVSTSQVVDECKSVRLHTAGDAAYGDLTQMLDALSAGRVSVAREG